MPDVTPVKSPEPSPAVAPVHPPTVVSQIKEKPPTVEPAKAAPETTPTPIPASVKPRVRPTPVTTVGAALPGVVSPSIEKNGRHTSIKSFKGMKADAITATNANKDLGADDKAYIAGKIGAINAQAVVVDVHIFQKTGQGKDGEISMHATIKGVF